MNKKLILLFGPPAVGKMTVGQELTKITGLKLLHNHVSLELANQFFDWSTPPFQRIDRMVRFGIFREVAKSNLPGLIFTFVWAVDLPKELKYLEEIEGIFKAEGAEVHYVELEANLEERLRRNRTENRLLHKPSKRDIPFSEQLIHRDEEKYRLNTVDGEHPEKNIIKIVTDELTAAATAAIIKERLEL